MQNNMEKILEELGIKVIPFPKSEQGVKELIHILDDMIGDNKEVKEEVEKGNKNPYDGEIVRIGKEFTFDSAHNLLDYDGACSRLHGHTYHLTVTLLGQLEKGMVVDFKKLKSIVNLNVINKLDHRYLNEIMEENPTAENLAIKIYNILDTCIHKEFRGRVVLESIKLYETPDSYVEYGGGIE